MLEEGSSLTPKTARWDSILHALVMISSVLMMQRRLNPALIRQGVRPDANAALAAALRTRTGAFAAEQVRPSINA
jgi:hypothetical protein